MFVVFLVLFPNDLCVQIIIHGFIMSLLIRIYLYTNICILCIFNFLTKYELYFICAIQLVLLLLLLYPMPTLYFDMFTFYSG